MNGVIGRAALCVGIAILATTAAFPESKTGAKQASVLPDCPPLADQVLRCPKLGFTYKVPFGWVDRTQAMQESAAPATKVPSAAELGDSGQPVPSGRTLLAIFERPPGTARDAVNSAVIIAVEDRAAYPQLKAAIDYFGPLSEVAEQRGLKMDGDPYAVAVGAKQLIRADFSGEAKPAVKQRSLVLLEKGYILSFTFLSASEEEVDELIKNLSFGAARRKIPHK